MKVLIIWPYYEVYLEYFYDRNKNIEGLSFEEHRMLFFNDHYGWPSDLSQYMNNMGIETEFIISNSEKLQKRWALENGLEAYSENNWEKEIAFEQIKKFKPDILWVSETHFFGDFINRAKSYCKKIITWISSETPSKLDFSGISMLLTSQPDILQEKHHLFEKIIVTYPGFNRHIIEELGNIEKKHDFVFIGQFTSSHKYRTQVLAYLIQNGIDLKIFGSITRIQKSSKIKRFLGDVLKQRDLLKGIKTIREPTADVDYNNNIKYISSACQGPVFGLDYYRVLAQSKVGLNIHSDISGDYVDNMRMFETTGVGTCLMTTESINNIEIFEPDKEILTFNSKEHLLDIVRNIDFNKTEIKQISKAGQRKTLSQYSIERMYENIKEIFE